MFIEGCVLDLLSDGAGVEESIFSGNEAAFCPLCGGLRACKSCEKGEKSLPLIRIPPRAAHTGDALYESGGCLDALALSSPTSQLSSEIWFSKGEHPTAQSTGDSDCLLATVGHNGLVA